MNSTARFSPEPPLATASGTREYPSRLLFYRRWVPGASLPTWSPVRSPRVSRHICPRRRLRGPGISIRPVEPEGPVVRLAAVGHRPWGPSATAAPPTAPSDSGFHLHRPGPGDNEVGRRVGPCPGTGRVVFGTEAVEVKHPRIDGLATATGRVGSTDVALQVRLKSGSRYKAQVGRRKMTTLTTT